MVTAIPGEMVEIPTNKYLPRCNEDVPFENMNGFITGYRIETSIDGSYWEVVKEGTWELSKGWKKVTFDTLETKYVRLIATSTWADIGNNNEMSIAELRILTNHQ